MTANDNKPTNSKRTVLANPEVSFERAFSAARAGGADRFTWRGNEYHTRVLEECPDIEIPVLFETPKEAIQMPDKTFFGRLHDLFPGVDEHLFNEWWLTPQPLLGGNTPSQTSPEEIENLIASIERYHATKNEAGK